MVQTTPRNITVNLYTPHAGQRPVHLSRARFRVVPCGRRFGKTYLGCNEFVKFACEHPNALLVWVAPTYRQSKIAYRLIKQALGELISHTSDSELLIELPNNARMMFCSSDNYDALRGNGIHFLVLDECADVAEKAWTEVLRPTLSDTKGRALFLGTPKGRNFFYTLYQRGLDPLYPDWESFTAPTSANPYIAPEEIAAAKSELPEMAFLQEYEAVFLEESAGVFRGIDGCIRGELCEPQPGYTYVVGWDIAKYQDFSVITVINCHTRHVDYFERSNQVDYTVQVERVCEIARHYNDAYILQDMTGVGDPVLEQLHLKGMHAEGYLFTNASKKTLIETLVVGIQNQDVSFPQIDVLIAELRQMQYTLSPSRLVQYSAPDGSHDDTVISLALAYYAAQRPHVPLSDYAAPTPVQPQPTLLPFTAVFKPKPDGSGSSTPPAVPAAVVAAQIDPFQWAEQHMGGDW